MYITEVTKRYGNNFHFKAFCFFCDDGYTDAFYQNEVFPSRFCSKCGLNSFGESAKDLSEVSPEVFKLSRERLEIALANHEKVKK